MDDALRLLFVAALAGALAAALVIGFLVMRRRQGAEARRRAALAVATMERALRGAARVARVGERAGERREIVDALVEESRAAVGTDAVFVVPGRLEDEGALSTELAAVGAAPGERLVVALERAAPTALVAVRPGLAAYDRAALEALADVARAALAALDGRRAATDAAEEGASVAEIARRLPSLWGPDAVAAAVAGELRVRYGVRAVGVALGRESLAWYPDPPGPEFERHERPLVVGGARLGTLVVAGGPTDPERLELVERLLEAAGIALELSRLRGEREALGEAEAALVAVADAVASESSPDRLLGKLVDALPGRLGIDAAILWQARPDERAPRVVAVHGLSDSLLGTQLAAGEGPAGEAISSGRPASRGSAAREAIGPPVLRQLHRELAVPITWGPGGLGALSLASFAARPGFDQHAVALAVALGRLVSLALGNAESVAQGARQAQLDRAASVVAAELAVERGTERVRQAIARAAQAAFGADRAIVRVGDELVAAASSGADGAPLGAPLALERLCAAERRLVAAGRLATDSRVGDEERRRLGPAGALLAIPLAGRAGDAAVGVATLLWHAPRAFADDELELADRLRRSAADALERADLEEAERRAIAMTRELQRVGALVAADLDAQVVLRQITAEAVSLLRADACVLRLVEGDVLVPRAVHGASAELLAERLLPADDAISSAVLAATEPVAIVDLAADARVDGADPLLAEAGFAGFLGAPVQSGDGDVRGVLVVYDRGPRVWRRDEVDAIAAVANSAAVALRNALLYERVALEKERGEAILGQIADAIVTVDAAGRVTMWNAAAEAVTLLPAARARGRELGELLRTEFGDVDRVAHRELRDALREQAPREVRLTRAGRDIWLSVAAASLREPHAEQPGVVYAIRDVSAERQLDQLKSDFVATVSHELRTPLTSIYGFAETLLRGDVQFGEDDRQTFLRYIASEAERLTRLVEGLLSVTRLEAGAVQLALEPVDVAAAAREVATWAEARSTRHRVEIVVPPEPLLAEADRDRIRQVLINLVDNGMKYSPQGGTVTVQARRRQRVVEVRVIDQGIGISERDQRNLFRKFFRVDAEMSRGIGGIGLGLYLVRGFVAAMGGRIWVESEEGRGSTFVFELPAAQPAGREGRAA